MSFHNNPDYHIPELIEALKAHRLPHDTPSQLADSFRIGWMACCRELAQAESVQEDAAREAIEKVLALFPFNVPIQKFTVNNGPCLTADNDDEFYSVKRVLAFLTEIKTTLDAARKQGGV